MVSGNTETAEKAGLPAMEVSGSCATETAEKAGLPAMEVSGSGATETIEKEGLPALEVSGSGANETAEKAGLTAEQLQRIEHNRAAALERKRRREESVHQESTVSMQTAAVPQVDAHLATSAAHTDAV